MREITTHHNNRANTELNLVAVDEPGPGGANHVYAIYVGDFKMAELVFQNGPILEAGVNGLTHEVLLAVILDRLSAFQQGDFRCRENALAITKLEEAIHWLNHRTQDRINRGVEGTHQK